MLRLAAVLLSACVLVTGSRAQTKPAVQSGSPFSFYTSVGGTYDSFDGWNTELDNSIRLALGNQLALRAGVPLYLFHQSVTQTAAGTTNTRYNSVGDVL